MVVDIGLPGMSGIELCTALRAKVIDVPILILSARDEVGDRVAGRARRRRLPRKAVRARRARRPAPRPAATGARPTGASGGRSVAGPLWVDLDRRRATANWSPLDLSRREFDLLSAFVANPGIVLSWIRLLSSCGATTSTSTPTSSTCSSAISGANRGGGSAEDHRDRARRRLRAPDPVMRLRLATAPGSWCLP